MTLASDLHEYSELEAKLNYTFTAQNLLTTALTHSTYVNEHPDCGSHNERLEFLGDAVLNLLTAKLLFELFSEHSEGELTRRRARLVCKESLATMGQNLNLDKYLKCGQTFKSEKMVLPASILADTFEAVVGAVFMDGGYRVTEACFCEILTAAIENSTPTDFKTLLQEACQSREEPLPEYRLVETHGPAHALTFTYELVLSGQVVAKATASSKKAAEQACAQQGLAQIDSAFTQTQNTKACGRREKNNV